VTLAFEPGIPYGTGLAILRYTGLSDSGILDSKTSTFVFKYSYNKK